jgi:hypothetical protein
VLSNSDQGGKCGGVFVNRIFEKMVNDRLGSNSGLTDMGRHQVWLRQIMMWSRAPNLANVATDVESLRNMGEASQLLPPWKAYIMQWHIPVYPLMNIQNFQVKRHYADSDPTEQHFIPGECLIVSYSKSTKSRANSCFALASAWSQKQHGGKDLR